jgi:hypothetical protein
VGRQLATGNALEPRALWSEIEEAIDTAVVESAALAARTGTTLRAAYLAHLGVETET